MRHLISLFGLLVLSFSCTGQTIPTTDKPQNDVIQKSLKGKVKALTESIYEMVEKFGETQKGGLREKFVYKFNHNGYETDFASYEPGSSKPSSKRTTKYDVKGKKIEQSDYDYNMEGGDKVTYKYDSEATW